MKRLSEIAKQGKIDENASLTDRQSIIINAPIESVWNHLINIDQWPNWNKNITNVSTSNLKDENRFLWTHAGKKFDSKLAKVSEPSTLSWTGKSGWVKAIHLWTLDKTDENQTVVSVEESLQGFLLFMFMSHRKLHTNLIYWLNELKKVAESESTLA